MATVNEAMILQLAGTQLLGRFQLLAPVILDYLLRLHRSKFTALKRGLRTISSWVIFVGTLFNFGLGTAQWAGLGTGVILETRTLLVEYSAVPLEARIGIYEQAVMKLQTPLAVLEAVPRRNRYLESVVAVFGTKMGDGISSSSIIRQFRNLDRSHCKRKQYQCSGNTEWLPSIFVPIISDECDHYIADWLEAFDRGPLTSISFAPSVLSQRSSRRSQSSALNWAHKKADATEGSDTLEMLERDSDVFENEGMGLIGPEGVKLDKNTSR
ncbi:hypothetical protein BJ912DRAFT_1043015 [Pholiota molesta]|nr:hypothetical protein BJ912DRAFT_1043015 [Pholiota molesta]